MPRTNANLQPLLASRLRLERLDILDTEPVPQRFFPILKKRVPTRYQMPCSCHSRPAAEGPEEGPEEKPDLQQDRVARRFFTTPNNCTP